jgi:hypothetical protein
MRSRHRIAIPRGTASRPGKEITSTRRDCPDDESALAARPCVGVKP